MMNKIQIYQGNRVKDGAAVRGYAAQGTECGKTFILVPSGSSSFRTYEVTAESLVPVL